MAQVRIMTLEIEVVVPAATSENEVAIALNQALDEPLCDWGDWEIGALRITRVRRESMADEEPA